MGTRRRFYRQVSVTDEHAIALDGRLVKTPMKLPLQLPRRALAEAVAAEWAAQGAEIDPSRMIMTRLANTAIDRLRDGRAQAEAELLDYAGSDLVCYRADRPPDLVARQAEAWDPVVDWARTVLDAPVIVTEGLIHAPQPDAAGAACAAAARRLSGFELAAVHALMTLSGSALIGLMLARAALAPERAWRAAHVDEDYQIAQWGSDAEAEGRRAVREAEFMAACRFLALLRDG
jgi:chaperone required for assembly of F1-ATPase